MDQLLLNMDPYVGLSCELLLFLIEGFFYMRLLVYHEVSILREGVVAVESLATVELELLAAGHELQVSVLHD